MNKTRLSIRAVLAKLNTALVPITQSVISRKHEQLLLELHAKQALVIDAIEPEVAV